MSRQTDLSPEIKVSLTHPIKAPHGIIHHRVVPHIHSSILHRIHAVKAQPVESIMTNTFLAISNSSISRSRIWDNSGISTYHLIPHPPTLPTARCFPINFHESFLDCCGYHVSHRWLFGLHRFRRPVCTIGLSKHSSLRWCHRLCRLVLVREAVLRCCGSWVDDRLEQVSRECVEYIAILYGSRPFLTEDCQTLRTISSCF